MHRTTGDVKVWLGDNNNPVGPSSRYVQKREVVERESAADKAAAAVAAAMSKGLYRPEINAAASSKAPDDDDTSSILEDVFEEDEDEGDDLAGDECFMGCAREASAVSKSVVKHVIRRLDLLIGLTSLAVAIWLRVSRGRERPRWRWVLFIACAFLGAFRVR